MFCDAIFDPSILYYWYLVVVDAARAYTPQRALNFSPNLILPPLLYSGEKKFH